jgi:hypothetical protein
LEPICFNLHGKIASYLSRVGTKDVWLVDVVADHHELSDDAAAKLALIPSAQLCKGAWKLEILCELENYAGWWAQKDPSIPIHTPAAANEGIDSDEETENYGETGPTDPDSRSPAKKKSKPDEPAFTVSGSSSFGRVRQPAAPMDC